MPIRFLTSLWPAAAGVRRVSSGACRVSAHYGTYVACKAGPAQEAAARLWVVVGAVLIGLGAYLAVAEWQLWRRRL